MFSKHRAFAMMHVEDWEYLYLQSLIIVTKKKLYLFQNQLTIYSKIISQADKTVKQQIISLFGFGKSCKPIHPDKSLLTWANSLLYQTLCQGP